MSFLSKIKGAVSDYNQNRADKAAVEAARKQSILDGDLEPIETDIRLNAGEKAYLVLSAKRMASVDSVVEETTGKSKKKDVVTRAVVGGVLIGPLGALGGAATAGSKHKTITTQKTVSELKTIDAGQLLFTDRRMVLVGNNVLSLPYDEMVSVRFIAGLTTVRMDVKYADMLSGEYFTLSGVNVRDTELYYRGITEHLKK